MKPFNPQLSQQDLAEMIDREGLAFEFKAACTSPGSAWSYGGLCTNAHSALNTFGSIRLAPGALTEFGLKPGMVPHNPDGLPADQITEGGKWRAAHSDEPFHHDGFQYWSSSSQEWTPIWYGGEEWYEDHKRKYTLRVPVGTPFSKPSRTVPPAEQSSATQRAGHDSDCYCGRCREDREDNPSRRARQSLTPRTDAVVRPYIGSDDASAEEADALLDHARILETELTAALAQRDEALKLIEEMTAAIEAEKPWRDKAEKMLDVSKWSGKSHLEGLVTEFEEARAEAQRLRETILKILPGMKAQSPPALGAWNWPYAIKELEEALEGQTVATSATSPNPFRFTTMEVNPNGCGCSKCNPKAGWMVVCPECKNKRCPKASDHEFLCTRSNALNQKGVKIKTAHGKEWWVHDGSYECPCDPEMRVSVEFEGGYTDTGEAGIWSWNWASGEEAAGNITAWRPADAPDKLPREGGGSCLVHSPQL